MNSVIGQILLWIGFLSGALATVFSTGDYARLGVTVTDVKSENESEKNRVLFNNVADNSIAQESGIQVDDRLVSFNDQTIESAAVFSKLLGAYSTETPAQFVIERNGQPKELDIKIKSQWATINWIWYLGSAALCILGIVFVRKSKNEPQSHAAQNEVSLQQLRLHLNNLVGKLEQLNQEIKGYKPRQILNFIEGELQDDLREFAEGRDAITAEYGLQIFAEVMTEFASGERAINRAWSASADGYIEEAAVCIERALAMLKLAQTKLNAG